MIDGGTDPNSRRPYPSTQEVSFALAYVNQIEEHVSDNLANLSVTSRGRLRSYFRQPNLWLRDTLAESLADEILEESKQSYGSEASEYPDIHERVLFFGLAKARMIDHVRYATLGNREQSAPESGLIMKTFGNLAWALPPTDEATIDRIMVIARSLIVTDSKLPQWYQAKMNTFLNPLDSKRVMSQLFETAETGGDIEALATANNELATEIAYLQKYMPKQCVAPALPGQRTKEWMVVPGVDVWQADRYHPSHELRFLMIGSTTSIDTSETSVVTYGPGNQQMQIMEFQGLADKEITAAVALGIDGELYSTLGQKFLDYIPEEQREAYEQLRAEVLCIYHDSVVPVYVTELVDQEIGEKEAVEPTADKSPLTDKLRRLVLARKLVSETLQEEIIEELENPNKDIVDSKHREMARHQVIGHIRRLPKHWKANPKARNLCREFMGIELAEYGETFVIPHERGDQEVPSKGHKAAFVVGKVASANESEQ